MPVPQGLNIVEATQPVSQVHSQEVIEQSVGVPAPPRMEEIAEACQLVPRTRGHPRVVEQQTPSSVLQIVEDLAKE